MRRNGNTQLSFVFQDLANIIESLLIIGHVLNNMKKSYSIKLFLQGILRESIW